MFVTMPFEQFELYAKSFSRVPVYRVLPADLMTPITAYLNLQRPGGQSFLLESAENGGEEGRYSFLGFHPQVLIRHHNGRFTITQNNRTEARAGAPFQLLREALAEHGIADVPGLPPLACGAVGYISYDSVRYLEKIPRRHSADSGMADISFGIYDTLVAFDHGKKTVTLICNVNVMDGPRKAYQNGLRRIEEITLRIGGPAAQDGIDGGDFDCAEFEPDMDDEEFSRNVALAQERIKAGDIFQVVLSRTFAKKCSAGALQIYRALRVVSPAPFMFFLAEADRAFVGASPERLVRVANGTVDTMPIAGTRRRHSSGDDSAVAEDLLGDPKERAEHMMLVDLARNDIGRVAQAGTVRLRSLAQAVAFSHVMHIRSEVEGRLAAGCDAVDALCSVFPAGTLSGAPKIRAMQIIDELESSGRGLYGGAVGYIDSRGGMDTCIAIRFAELRDGVVRVRAGAGIVSDSDPRLEAEETRNKARPVMQAIEMAERGAPCFS